MNNLKPKQFAILIGVILLILLVFQLYRNQSDRDDYQSQSDVIIDATEKWLDDHRSIVLDETEMTISLYVLKQDGYIKNDFQNPNTRMRFSNDLTISIVKKKDQYQISVLDDVASSSGSYDDVDVTAPRVLLRGSAVLYTEINKEFVDPGVIAYNSENGNVYGVETLVTKEGTPLRDVDITQLNTYDVKYTAEYAKIYSSIHRTVIVRDTKAPKIDAPKLIITLDQVDGLDLMSGVTVTDNSNEEINIKVEGSVSKKIGKYLIVYKAVDSSGNETTKKRVVRVSDSLSDEVNDDEEDE